MNTVKKKVMNGRIVRNNNTLKQCDRNNENEKENMLKKKAGTHFLILTNKEKKEMPNYRKNHREKKRGT